MPKGKDSVARTLRIPAPGGLGPLPFSMGVFAGETFYTGGHIGLDPQTKKVPAAAEEEIRLMLDSFRATLARAGLSMNHLVFVQVFCADVSLFEQFNSIYSMYFGAEFPARAFIGSGPLLFDARFEIQGIATKLLRSRSASRDRARKKRRSR